MELPAADAGLEDRAGPGRRQHRRAQAGRDHAADRAAVRRGLPAGRAAARRRQHPHRRRRDRARRWSSTPTSTRSRSPARPRSARRSRASLAGTGTSLTLELGGKAANIVFDDAPIDQAVEGIVNGIFFNQGHVCCAGSRLLVQEYVLDPLLDKLKRRLSTLRLGDPMDKNTDIGAINSAAQLARITELADAGEAEGADPLEPAVRAAAARLLVRADALHRRRPGPPHRPRGDLRPGAVGADVPHARPRRSRRPTTRRTGCRPASGPTRARASSRWRAAAGRRGVGQHVQQVRPDVAVRRLQGVGLRPRGRPPRTRRLPAGACGG